MPRSAPGGVFNAISSGPAGPSISRRSVFFGVIPEGPDRPAPLVPCVREWLETPFAASQNMAHAEASIIAELPIARAAQKRFDIIDAPLERRILRPPRLLPSPRQHPT